jgi:DNA-binding PadR family transcriptional regulator
MNRTTNHSPRPRHPRRGGPQDRSLGHGHGHGHGPGRGRGPQGARGPEGFGEAGSGFGPGFGPGFGRRGGRRGRRGDVRKAVLSLLAEQPMNGYQVITAIAERSDGGWQPGPGSVYPAMYALREEGLIDQADSGSDAASGRRKVHELTDEGRAYVAEHAEELREAWEQSTTPQRGFRELRQEVHQLHGAIQQVGMSGRTETIDAAQKVLAEARRSIYRILAEDDTSTG